jgi:hypothetical protein
VDHGLTVGAKYSVCFTYISRFLRAAHSGASDLFAIGRENRREFVRDTR